MVTPSDIDKDGLLAHLPCALRPYALLARWDRPIGTWLLLLPGWWALCLAPGLPSPWLMTLFAFGSIVMRGAGCTLNDILDRDLDAQVARARARPLPSGMVTLHQAIAWLALQSVLGLLILLQLTPLAIGLGVASLALVGTYPLMKRITWWPQLFLGITFNWGVLVGWAAATGTLTPPALWLYAAGIAWTLVYDTIYAHQDKSDDALIGVKSTARLFGERSRPILCGFAVLFMLGLLAAGTGQGWGYYLGLLAVAAHLTWQLKTWQPDDPVDCLRKFRANRDCGLLVLVAILLGKIT